MNTELTDLKANFHDLKVTHPEQSYLTLKDEAMFWKVCLSNIPSIEDEQTRDDLQNVFRERMKRIAMKTR